MPAEPTFFNKNKWFCEGVERIFQTHSKMIDSVEVKRRGKVRQAKLNIEQTDEGRIALVGCETDLPSVSGDASFDPVSFTKLVAVKICC
jgi:hypothetical protein